MHEAAWPLVAYRGGNDHRATLKSPRLMHAYAHLSGLRNRRSGRVSLSGGLWCATAWALDASASLASISIRCSSWPLGGGD